MKKTTKHSKKPIRKPVDFAILISTITLVFIGIIMVYSSSAPEGMVRFNNQFHFAKGHFIWAIVGLVGMLIAMNIDYSIWKKLSPFIFALSIIACLLIFTPLGIEIKGATRWINLGFTTFMPSDAMKVGSIMFLATFLSTKKKDVASIKQGMIPAFIIIGISAGLVFLQKDLGTPLAIATTLLAMYFVGGMNLFVIPVIIGLGAIALRYALFSEKFKYRLNRLTAFRDPFADKLDTGYQIVQSLYALGSGGILGAGLGKSRQKFFYISESYNDFIFAIIGEELGLLGAIFVVALYTIIILKGIKIAINAKDDFGRYLATGITALIFIQSFMHMLVVTSSIPVTGITLPLISFGGTSLVMFLGLIGILLNISKTSLKEVRK